MVPRGGGGGFGFLHVLAGLFGMALFFALLLGLAALAYKLAVKKGWLPGRSHRGPRGPRPEPEAPHAQQPGGAQRILDERLARGEIEIDDYKARRDALSGNSFPPFHQPPQPGHPGGQPPADQPHPTATERTPHVPPMD